MVTIEVELDTETLSELSLEAAEFEFRGSEQYLRWLIEHRAVTLSRRRDFEERLEEIERRVAALEGDGSETRSDGEDHQGTDERTDSDDHGDGRSSDDHGEGPRRAADAGRAGAGVRATIDDLLATTESADDDEIERAVAVIEGGNETEEAEDGTAEIDGRVGGDDLRL